MLSTMYMTKFAKEGLQVLRAADGLEALALAKKERPALILLDVIMPKMDGFAALKELKKDPDLATIPVWFLTNLGQEEDVKKGTTLGADGYFIKAKHTPGDLVVKIREILSKGKKK